MNQRLLLEINRNKELMGLPLIIESTGSQLFDDILSVIFPSGTRPTYLTNWSRNIGPTEIERESLENFKTLGKKFYPSLSEDDALQKLLLKIQRAALSPDEIDEVYAFLIKSSPEFETKLYQKFIDYQMNKPGSILKTYIDDANALASTTSASKSKLDEWMNDTFTSIDESQIDDYLKDLLKKELKKTVDELKVKLPSETPSGWNKSWDDIETLTPEELEQIEKLAGTGFVNKFRQFTQGLKDFFTKEAQQIDEVTSLIRSYGEASVTEKTAILQRVSLLLEQLTKVRTKNFADYKQFLETNVPDRTLRTKFNNEGILKSARVLSDGSEWAEWLKLNKTIQERRAALRQTWIDMIKPSWSKSWKETFTTKEGSSVLPGTFLKKWSNIISSKKYKEYRWSLVYGGTLSFKQIGYLFKKFGWRVAVTELSKEYGLRTMNYILLMAAVDIATDYLAYAANSVGIYFGKDLSQFKPIQNQLEDYYNHSSAEEEKSEIEVDESGKPIPRTNLERIIDSLEDVGGYLINIGLENAELKNLIGGFGDDILLYAGALNDPQDEEAMRREGQRLVDESQRIIETGEGVVSETTDSLGVQIPDGDSIVSAVETMPTQQESTQTDTSGEESNQETEEVSMDEVAKSIIAQKGEKWFKKYVEPEGGDVVDNRDGTFTIIYSDVNDSSLKGFYTTVKQVNGKWVYATGAKAGQEI